MRRFFVLAVALSVLVLLPGFQVGIATAQPPDFAKAIAAQERHNPLLLNLPGVAGTGVGVSASGAAVIRIYLEAHGVGVPAVLDNVPVEAVVTGPFFARCAQTECPRPVPLGVSTGHPAITAGTIGARVKDGSGNVYALSNNHVYANSNNASIGDGALQPGPYDGGTDPADRIGTLAAFKVINFSGGNNDIDAAIALSSTALLGNSTFSSGYTPTSTPVEGTLNLPVKKQGRTTGLTTGQISEVNVTLTVCYATLGPFCVKSAKYVNQLAIGGGTFSAGGDSGSLIVTQSGNHPVGLLFAGGSTRTIANRIQAVLAWFGVTIDSSAGGSTNNPPTASFTFSCSGLICNFDGSASDDPDGSGLSYSWDFGDNSSPGSGVTASHTYAAGGTYAVTLTVTDNGGATGLDSQSVTVSAPAGAITLTVVGYKVRGFQKADLSWSPSSPPANVDVFRNGAKVTTTTNDGFYTDDINKKGSGSYTYQVCEAVTSICSNLVTIIF